MQASQILTEIPQSSFPAGAVTDVASDEIKLRTGSEPLDRLLSGGLLPGETVEMYGQRSGGRFSMVMTALASVIARGESAALVDLGDCLDPRSAAAAGVDLEQLLWVRPQNIHQAMESALAITRSGVPLLVIDLGIPPIPGEDLGEDAWIELARSAEEHGVALLISTPYRISGAAAGVVVESFQPDTRWLDRDASWILGGLSSHLELRTQRTFHDVAAWEGGAEVLSLRAVDRSPSEETDPLELRAIA